MYGSAACPFVFCVTPVHTYRPETSLVSGLTLLFRIWEIPCLILVPAPQFWSFSGSSYHTLHGSFSTHIPFDSLWPVQWRHWLVVNWGTTHAHAGICTCLSLLVYASKQSHRRKWDLTACR